MSRNENEDNKITNNEENLSSEKYLKFIKESIKKHQEILQILNNQQQLQQLLQQQQQGQEEDQEEQEEQQQSEQQTKQRLSFHDLFTSDNSRYILKLKSKIYFDIFPWFLIPRKSSFRYRESLHTKRGDNINEVIDCINFFLFSSFTDKDFELLQKLYLQIGVPKGLFWPIIKLKNEFEILQKDQRSKGIFLDFNLLLFLIL